MAQDAPYSRRRPRPVADAPIEGPLARSEALAKEWLFALIAARPLTAAAQLAGARYVRAAPELIGALLQALVSDAALAELEPGGASRSLAAGVGAIEDGGSLSQALQALDALSDTVWAALRDELRAADGELAAELAARLGRICATVRDAVVERSEALGGAYSQAEVDGERGAVGLSGPPDAVGPHPSASAEPAATAVATPPPPPAVTALWQDALEAEISRSRIGGGPLSLLLAELEDAERLAASAAPDQAQTASIEFIAALRRALRAQDILVGDTGTRAWVIARATARAGAHALAAKVAEAVGESPETGGAPLVASVGVAVLGEDGERASELIEAAEEARFAASARGVEVARRIPDAERDGDAGN